MALRLHRSLTRLASASLLALGLATTPATSYAGTTPPVPVVDVGGGVNVGNVDTSPVTDLLAGKTVACPLNSHYMQSDYLTSSLDATQYVNTGHIDYIWHASPYAKVSSPNSCVTGIRVASQLHDRSEVPGCQPVYDSPVVTTDDNSPMHWVVSGVTDYEVESPVDLRVTYFDVSPAVATPVGPVTVGAGTAGSAGKLTPHCERVHSTVTVDGLAYYRNYLNQYVLFCAQTATYEFLGTPAGPQQVGDPIETSTC